MPFPWLLAVGAYPVRAHMDGPDNQSSVFLTDMDAAGVWGLTGVSTCRLNRRVRYLRFSCGQVRQPYTARPVTVSSSCRSRGRGPVSYCLGAAYGPSINALEVL